jgi:hypothetical protein
MHTGHCPAHTIQRILSTHALVPFPDVRMLAWAVGRSVGRALAEVVDQGAAQHGQKTLLSWTRF